MACTYGTSKAENSPALWQEARVGCVGSASDASKKSGWDSNEFDQEWLGASTIYIFFNDVKAIIGQDDY